MNICYSEKQKTMDISMFFLLLILKLKKYQNYKNSSDISYVEGRAKTTFDPQIWNSKNVQADMMRLLKVTIP